MSESSSTEERASDYRAEDDGWCLEKASWGFHRSTFRLLGQPLPYGEYGHLRRQISSGAAELLRFGGKEGLYRVQLRDGTALDVLARTGKGKLNGKVWYVLTRAMRPAGKPRVAASPTPAPVEAVEAAPLPPPVPPVAVVAAPPPPEPVRRASTLTLGTSARTAAEVLAARLQPKAPPPRLESVPAPAPKQTLKPAPKSPQTPKPPQKKPPQQKQRAQGRR